MSRFNPRYKLNDNKVTSICGIQEDVLNAILDLCVDNSSEKRKKKNICDATEAFNEEKIETVKTIRDVYKKDRSGKVRFDISRTRDDIMLLHRIESVFTSASLQWSRIYDNDSYILVYLSNLRNGKLGSKGEPSNLNLTPLQIRTYLTLKTLQDHRDEYYRNHESPAWKKMKNCYPLLHLSREEREGRLEGLRHKKEAEAVLKRTLYRYDWYR